MSVYEQPQESFEQQESLATYQHLLTSATEMGLDTASTMGLTSDTDVAELDAVAAQLKQAINDKFLRDAFTGGPMRPICKIGPYANGRCTICSLRQPD